jgi:hypothetical protein
VSITIAHRYRGPATSGNGGYTAGLLADVVGGAVEVTLRLPPPLDTPLEVQKAPGGGILLCHGERVIAEARPAEPDVTVPPTPTWDEASALSGTGVVGWGSPDFAECFVCGDRADGTGLRIHAQPVPGSALVAACWRAVEVSVATVWAAIDCPGAYAVGEPGRGEPLLGRMTARIERLPHDGERCVVAGWSLGVDGRKLHAGTAIVGEDGVVLARARQVWIEPRAS